MKLLKFKGQERIKLSRFPNKKKSKARRMLNIQRGKIVERPAFECMSWGPAGMDNFCRGYEPSYSKAERLSLDLSEGQSQSGIKSTGLWSTKSRGLNLSSKQQFEPNEDVPLLRRKTASTLVKTAHTIHYLGRSLSKSKDDVSKSISTRKKKSMQEDNFAANSSLMSCTLSHQQISTPQRESSYSLNQHKHYTVKITPPKNHLVIDQSQGYSRNSKDSKVSKITELRKKDFLRSSKKQNYANLINTPQLKHPNTLAPPPNLNTSAKQLEVKSKRQFLQSYIEKPMINSIILSGKIENLTDEPQSPVLRLKKRLQLNSINCIYEKQTLVSKEFHDNRSSTIQVQESVIVHRNISENIRPLMHKINLFSEGDENPYKLYLGQEIEANLVVTVKELPLESFEKFARELRIYQEIESGRMEMKNVLELIKHSTDSDKHLLLKEPFTETLNDYLENFVSNRKAIRLEFEYVVDAILRVVRRVIEEMEGRGMVLGRRLMLSDLVFVFMNLKFENLEMFVLGRRQTLNKEEILEGFRVEMENYMNRISCGSLDF